MNTQQVQTTCPYCGVGCGVVATVDEAGSVAVAGDTHHPANLGKLCSKGSALAETLTLKHRLLQPLVNDQPVSWSEALDHVASALTQTLSTHGPDSVAFYVSGQLLTEDYYVINKLTKGWIGTANIDSNSRLCMASSVTGHKRAFGSDTVPGCYEDLEQADVILLVGSNLAWCHPVLYQRIMAEKQRRPALFIIAIDPRRTATADMADMHLPIQPDGDTLLFNALLAYLFEQGLCDENYIQTHVSDFENTLVQAQSDSACEVAEQLGLEPALLQAFFEKVASHSRTVTLYSQGVNQSSSGTDKVNAIINTHLATGRVGLPGCGPFSITGQPNAMGGREVGGLATMLAAHMELHDQQHQRLVQNFWQSPHIASKPGLCAVDLFEAVNNGSIKAIWIIGTNPVDSVPDANRVARALDACPLVIVSDVCANTDTAAYANVLLPAQPWGEKDGTVTNSERCISRQRAIRKPVDSARPDWWIVSAVACRMGFTAGFTYQCAADIFREHAALSARENNGTRDFDIGAAATLSNTQYENMAPFYWPWKEGSAPSEPIRFFASGHFFTADGKASMKPVKAATPGNASLSNHYPMILNTGRIRDQWHTMTRTGFSPRLTTHLGEPFVEIHPQDALIHGIQDADIVSVGSPLGSTLLRASLSDRQTPGQVYAPMHWTDVFASRARVDTLISSVTDPYSRQPASKNQAVFIQRYEARSFAYVLHRRAVARQLLPDIQYWSKSPVENGWRYEMASLLDPHALQALITSLFSVSDDTVDDQSLSCDDEAAGKFRRAQFIGSQLQTLAIVANEPVELSRSWAQQLLTENWADKSRRYRLLAGRASADQPDKGAIVCSCFNVGTTQIEEAIEYHQCHTVSAIGERLQAGTNCGSCRSELQGIVNRCSHTLNRKCTTSPSRMT